MKFHSLKIHQLSLSRFESLKQCVKMYQNPNKILIHLMDNYFFVVSTNWIHLIIRKALTVKEKVSFFFFNLGELTFLVYLN